MGSVRLYNIRTGKWEWYRRADDMPKKRTGRRLRRITDSLRQTWRRITGDTKDRTYYTFNPSELRIVDEVARRRHVRLMRRAGRRASLMGLIQAVADAVNSMIEMQKFIK